MKMVVCTDGGCRDNPGPGAWGFVGLVSDVVYMEHSGFLPRCTNNQAEYRALEAACITISRMGADDRPASVSIFSDSMLIVQQINGRWQVKDELLRPFFTSALTAFRQLSSLCTVDLTWFSRENNTLADALCNSVMDRHGIVCSRKGRPC